MKNIKKSLVTYKNKTIGMSELEVLTKPFLDTGQVEKSGVKTWHCF